MRQSFMWFWKKGILSTFLAGLFALLPIVITLGIMAWAGGLLKEWLGPESFVGQALSRLGLRFVTNRPCVRPEPGSPSCWPSGFWACCSNRSGRNGLRKRFTR